MFFLNVDTFDTFIILIFLWGTHLAKQQVENQFQQQVENQLWAIWNFKVYFNTLKISKKSNFS